MDYETEVIKQQMSETRSSLGDKLETLEQKVTETLKDTKEAVSETVENVTSSVGETVDKVKETFNLSGYIERNPWLALGGSIAAGYALGMMFLPKSERTTASSFVADHGSHPMASVAATAYQAPTTGHDYETPVSAAPEESGSMLSSLASMADKAGLGPVLDQFRGFAIGIATSFAEEMIANALPEKFKSSVADLMSSVTHNLGGKVLDVPEEKSHDEHQPSSSSPSTTQPVI